MVLWTRGDVVNRTCLELTPTFQHEKTTMAIRYRPTLMIYHYPIDPEMGGVDLPSAKVLPVSKPARPCFAPVGR